MKISLTIIGGDRMKPEDIKHGHKIVHDQIKAPKNEPLNQEVIDGVINNERVFIPASLYGERIDSLTDYEESILQNYMHGKTWEGLEEDDHQ